MEGERELLEALDDLERASNRVRRALSSLGTEKAQPLIFDSRYRREAPTRDLLAAVAAYYGVAPADLRGPTRGRYVVEARHMAMYLLRDHLMLPWSQVGRLMDRDHSTVITAVVKVRRRVAGGYEDGAAILAKLRDAQSAQASGQPG